MAATPARPLLRNARLSGPRPDAFDIVLNNLAGLAWTKKKIAMVSDGRPWRPLVHGLDIAKAIRCVLAAPVELVSAEVFNVGSSEQNYRVREIAEIVGSEFPGCELSFGSSGGDNRSYRVSFDKINNKLPGFSCDWDAVAGARQLHQVFRRIDLDAATFTGQGHTRLLQLQHLITTGQVGRRALLEEAVSSPVPPSRGWPSSISTGARRPGVLRPHLLCGRVRRSGLGTAVEPSTLSFNHRAGTVRGMHYQVAPHPEAKLVAAPRARWSTSSSTCARGRPPAAARQGGAQRREIDARSTYRPHFAHGYQNLVDDTEGDLPGRRHLRAGGERGTALGDDPHLGLDWPLPVSVISPKDASWPLLVEQVPRLLSVLAEPVAVHA